MAFTINSPVDDILSINNKSGIYTANPDDINLPINTYGRVIISKNTDSKWIFVEFIPTSLGTIYYNFYNGYSYPGWSGWAKTPLQVI